MKLSSAQQQSVSLQVLEFKFSARESCGGGSPPRLAAPAGQGGESGDVGF